MPWVKVEDTLVMKGHCTDSFSDAEICEEEHGLLDALKWARVPSGNGLVVLAGSLYLVADFLSALQEDLSPLDTSCTLLAVDPTEFLIILGVNCITFLEVTASL